MECQQIKAGPRRVTRVSERTRVAHLGLDVPMDQVLRSQKLERESYDDSVRQYRCDKGEVWGGATDLAERGTT